MTDLEDRSKLQQLVSSYYWWHSIDLGNGIVTNGTKTLDIMRSEYDNTFSKIDLSGKTVLDIGTWNGGFAVEACRRGALSVTGLDHFTWNHPHFRGRETFELVSKATKTHLGAIDRDLDAPRLNLGDIGRFDIVLFLGVFYHLQNPLSALREVCGLVKETLVVESHIENLPDNRPAMVFFPGAELSGDSTNWWGPNVNCILELLKLMGFERVEVSDGVNSARKVFHAFRSRSA